MRFSVAGGALGHSPIEELGVINPKCTKGWKEWVVIYSYSCTTCWFGYTVLVALNQSRSVAVLHCTGTAPNSESSSKTTYPISTGQVQHGSWVFIDITLWVFYVRKRQRYTCTANSVLDKSSSFTTSKAPQQALQLVPRFSPECLIMRRQKDNEEILVCTPAIIESRHTISLYKPLIHADTLCFLKVIS